MSHQTLYEEAVAQRMALEMRHTELQAALEGPGHDIDRLATLQAQYTATGELLRRAGVAEGLALRSAVAEELAAANVAVAVATEREATERQRKDERLRLAQLEINEAIAAFEAVEAERRRARGRANALADKLRRLATGVVK